MAVLTVLSSLATTQASGAKDALWSAHVEPLLKQHCERCHNATKPKSGLDLGSFESILRGGDRGAVILPGRADDSPLIRSLAPEGDPHMPPKGQLSEEEIGVLKTWISKLENNKPSSSTTEASIPPSSTPANHGAPQWIPPSNWAPVRVIDHFVELGWKQRKAKPASLADDGTFLRRVSLDLIGRVPKPEETTQFLRDPRSDKRVRKVDDLLASPEFSRHFAEIMDVVLMGRRGPDQENQRRDHHWFTFLETSFRENRPWNQVVREMVIARPQRTEDRGATWYLYERKGNPQAMAEALAPVVFGVQIKCAQCHDHMVAREIKQAHYWGLVAALNRSKNVDTPAGPGVSESAIGGFVSFANLKKESQPALMTLFNGRSISEPWPAEGEKEVDAPEKYLIPPPAEKKSVTAPAIPKFSRRAALAEAVTENNPLLARAMVNRIWALMMGRGLVHPVDLMDSKHAPSHPELLEWLSEDFVRNGHDIHRLIRILASTRAYQLDSRPKGTVPPPPEAFAWALEKPLSAEQLYRSLLQVTANPVDNGGRVAGKKDPEWRATFIRQFPDLFAPEYNATLQQALFLSNSPWVDSLLQPREGNLTSQLLSRPSTRERARKAFQLVLGRDPQRDEWNEAIRYLDQRTPEAGTKQLLWALLTSTEFQTNH